MERNLKRLGVLVLAEPDNGGVFQYSLAMIEALALLPDWQKTVYRVRGSASYAEFGLPLRELPSSNLRSVALTAMDRIGLHIPDPFESEDIVISAMFSPYLLHTRTPFVYTLHDLQERHLPANFSVWQRSWRAFVQPRIAARAAKIICESTFVRDDLVRFFHQREEKIAVVQSPPLWQGEAELEVSSLAAVRARNSLPHRFLFYPAQFWPHKNHLRLIDAFARVVPDFPDVKLVLTGHRKFEYEAVKRHIEKLDLTDRVLLLGYVAGADIPALYRLSTALVMPSLFESISIPIYEAFRSGTPVCASNVLALRDQVGGAGLTFDPYSVDSMAVAIRNILSDPALREKLAESGKRKLSEMTRERYAQQLQGILDEALAIRSPSQHAARS
jgi:glycosyltransferase involved in cell wall biosynthesis